MDLPQSSLSYDDWSREQLISRIKSLENSRPSKEPGLSLHQQRGKPFDFDAHPKRKIALKFSYHGTEYSGLAFQFSKTPLPTVEGTLFAALARTHLVDGSKGLAGCEWERCGRTDAGVSSAGQVVSLVVRSALGAEALGSGKELRYVSSINRVLPPTIRIHAWSPVTPEFSARFSCLSRHYKYTFCGKDLDIDAMREACTQLVGEHDFRNMCKVDPSKQIASFKRRILGAQINKLCSCDEDAQNGEALFVFDLVGTAFLYNQVRHIMAILFLVGAGHEHPSIVSALLNVDTFRPYPQPVPDSREQLPVVDCRPVYQMANALPLVLWECQYAESDISWQVDPDVDPTSGSVLALGTNLCHQMSNMLERYKIETALNRLFLEAASVHHRPRNQLEDNAVMIPLGGGTWKREGRYVPLLKRERLEQVDVINARWLARKGPKAGQALNDDEE